MKEKELFYNEAFDRNIGILTKNQQKLIKNAKVAIVGLGGVGGIHATTLARTGFTKFHIADFDTFSLANFNRQVGATVETIDKAKTTTVKDLILAINPFAEVTTFKEGITKENIDVFLDGVSVVVDGIDFFSIEVRRLVFQRSQEMGIYVVSAGPIAFGGTVLVFSPKGQTFDSYMNIQEKDSEEEKTLKFGLGVTPSLLQVSYFRPTSISWKGKTARTPSLCLGTLLAASLAITEVVKIVTNDMSRIKCVPHSLHFDPYLRKMRRVWMPFGNKNPIQRIKLYIARILIKRNIIK